MRSYISFFFIIISQLISAQTTITGSLITNADQPAEGVSIMLHPKNEKNEIITYAFSDVTGSFNLQLATKAIAY